MEPWYLSLLSSLLSGLVGASVVYYFGIRQLITQRRLGYLEQQLTEFYAPLAGMRTQIRAKSELRQKVSAASEAAWQKIVKSYGERPMLDHEERFAPFKKIIEYDNEQLKAELLPKYREMLTLFTDRYHLATSDTRAFYKDFVEFVEIWDRWLAESLPPEVVEELGHAEATLAPFYEHLESRMHQLQAEIAQGRVHTRAGKDPSMANTSEGVRRLSFFAGGIGALIWFTFALFSSDFFSRIKPEEWLIVIGGIFVCFLVPLVFVRAAAWVVRGFTERRE